MMIEVDSVLAVFSDSNGFFLARIDQDQHVLLGEISRGHAQVRHSQERVGDPVRAPCRR